MNLSILIKPIGIATYCLLLFTIITGARVIKVKLMVHRLFGIIALISATIHGVLGIYLNYF